MKIENIRISTRLYLALGVILTLVAILAWEAVTRTDVLWLQTKTMYDYDNTVVDACLRLFPEKGFKLEGLHYN